MYQRCIGQDFFHFITQSVWVKWLDRVTLAFTTSSLDWVKSGLDQNNKERLWSSHFRHIGPSKLWKLDCLRASKVTSRNAVDAHFRARTKTLKSSQTTKDAFKALFWSALRCTLPTFSGVQSGLYSAVCNSRLDVNKQLTFLFFRFLRHNQGQHWTPCKRRLAAEPLLLDRGQLRNSVFRFLVQGRRSRQLFRSNGNSYHDQQPSKRRTTKK